ncbi:hypothetical protein [Cupriavidus sp. D384]|uniref:hypothetical protein n=1 Tax=Cupriavidus sp. D384 TaxID=1538095 RepID=UPI0012E92020|nr:hypothetical protein [Cupriavidus sp. D384]
MARIPAAGMETACDDGVARSMREAGTMDRTVPWILHHFGPSRCETNPNFALHRRVAPQAR